MSKSECHSVENQRCLLLNTVVIFKKKWKNFQQHIVLSNEGDIDIHVKSNQFEAANIKWRNQLMWSHLVM